MLRTFRKIVVQLNDKIEFSRQTTLCSGYSRRQKAPVSDLEIRQKERLQRSLICTAIARTLALCGGVCGDAFHPALHCDLH